MVLVLVVSLYYTNIRDSMKVKVIQVDVKSGKITETEKILNITTVRPKIANLINFQKLKNLLKNKGLISDYSEIE